MRSSSTTRKRTPNKSQNSRFIENKIFISNQHITPLSHNIASKLQLIKQQISRQLNERLPYDRKKAPKNSLGNINDSTSIKKTKSVNKLRSATMTPVQTRLNFQETDFRQKYYDAHQQYLNEKKNSLQTKQQLGQLKRAICNFLEEPCNQTGKALELTMSNTNCLNHILSEQRGPNESKMTKLTKGVEGIITLNEQVATYQTSLLEIMNALQVEDLESLMQEIQTSSKFSNLNECTYKILELEASNNKVCNQYEKKIEEIKTCYQDELFKLGKNNENQVKQLSQKVIELDKDLQKEKVAYQNLKEDLRQLRDNWKNREKEIIWNCEAIEVRDLHQIFVTMDSKIFAIKDQAEANMGMFIRTKEQLQRLQSILQQLNKNLQLQEQQDQDRLQQKDQQILTFQTSIQELKASIEQKTHQITQLMKSNQEDKSKVTLKCQQLQSYLRVISKKLCVEQDMGNQTIAAKIVDLKERLVSAEKYIKWHEQQLSTKEKLLKEFNFNIENLISENKQLKIMNKSIQSERDQYKYLLGNLREQIIQLRKEHKQAVEKIIQQRDDQIITSNRDILELNSTLTDRNSQLNNTVKKLKLIQQQKIKENQFLKRKTQQYQKRLKQKDNNLLRAEQECLKYKKYLNDIEASLKEVESMGEQTAHKIQILEKQNAALKSELQTLEQYKKTTKCEHLQKLKALQSTKSQLVRMESQLKNQKELQRVNSQLVVSNLQKDSQVRSLEEEVKRSNYQNKSLSEHNNKLVQKVNFLLDQKVKQFHLKEIKHKRCMLYYSNNQPRLSKLMCLVKETRTNNLELQIDLETRLKQLKTDTEKGLTLIAHKATNQIVIKQTRIDQLQKQISTLNIRIQQLNRDEVSKRPQQILVLSADYQVQTQPIDSLNLQKTDQVEHQQMLDSQRKVSMIQCNNILRSVSSIRNQTLTIKNQFTSFGVALLEWIQRLILQVSNLQTQRHKHINKIIYTKQQLHSVQNELVQIRVFHKTQVKLWDNSLLSFSKEYQSIIKTINAKKDQAKQVIQSQFYEDLLLKQDSFQLPKKSLQRRYQSPNKLCRERLASYVESEKETPTLGKQNYKPQIDDSANSYQNSKQIIANKNIMSQSQNDKAMIVSRQRQQQVQRVLKMLRNLKESVPKQPEITYYEQIRKEYEQVQKLIHKKTLNLDISEVQLKPHALSSPNSNSFTKQFISKDFDKRINTDPSEDIRYTNRSEKINSPVLHLHTVNKELKQELKELDEQYATLKQKYEYIQTERDQLKKINTELENASSSKTLYNMINKLVDHILKDEMDLFLDNLRVILKVIKVPSSEIESKMESLQKKSKKKGGGIFSKFFG